MSRATMVDLPPEEDQETTDTLDNEANEIQQLDLNLDVGATSTRRTYFTRKVPR